MSTVELKGQLLNIIARLEDENMLKDILEYCIDVAQGPDMLNDLSPDALAELQEAIQDSFQDDDGIPHDEVIQMAEEWLKK